MFTLANKTVFITGIGSGIGLCAAQSAIKLGASVYGTVFSDEQRETVKKFLPAECIYKVDITNSEEITAAVDGTPGSDDMPTRLTFATCADGSASPTERMRIDSSGRMGLGTQSPGSYSGAATQLSIAATGNSGLNIVSG
ncbi:MAG: SDR family NAD(P)-dependent oxidoreductase, partial [Proteobacteria bacterium]|nr:SDR family NAD(P)-dependent oxidoreductase [Pseudomonadota bacterium]